MKYKVIDVSDRFFFDMVEDSTLKRWNQVIQGLIEEYGEETLFDVYSYDSIEFDILQKEES